MAGTYTFQPSFAAGVLGPGLQGRIDLAKYQVGLKTGENIFIHAHGGFSNLAMETTTSLMLTKYFVFDSMIDDHSAAGNQ